MRKRIFSSLLILSIMFSTLVFVPSRQFAKEENEVANLALMLPESDIIVAIDIDKTLNVVGPSLLSQDTKKIDNLKKLMKSLENVIGMNPYQMKQIVAGIKLPVVQDKSFFDSLDFAVVVRTGRSNDLMLEDWSKRMDQIDAFNNEREPSEKYIDTFKILDRYKQGDDDEKVVAELSTELDEIVQMITEVNELLNGMPAAAKANRSFKDLFKKNKSTMDSIAAFQALLKKDADVKELREKSIKLRNRWNEVDIDDPKRSEKLNAILKESKEIYPGYREKVTNLARIHSLIDVSSYEFHDLLKKVNFTGPDISGVSDKDSDFYKNPEELMREGLEAVLKILEAFPKTKAKQTAQIRLISKQLQKVENSAGVWLKMSIEEGEFGDIDPETATQPQTPANLSKSIKENAKISVVNGKRLITIDPDKVNLWGGTVEPDKAVVPAAKGAADAALEAAKETQKKDEEAAGKDSEKKPRHFAIGYLDDKTMVLGFEPGIRAMLSRTEDYKNPRAAEMLKSFKNPLVSFATNSKIFQNFLAPLQPVEPAEKGDGKKEEAKIENKGVKKEDHKTESEVKAKDDEKKKKETPIDKFYNDLNIFGAVEYDGDGTAANDLMMSLGFTKNTVEDVFGVEPEEEESPFFDIGEYQISVAILYDLLNTLKAVKASVSFKFEKKKLAALIESAPQIIDDVRLKKTTGKADLRVKPKTKVRSLAKIEELLTTPAFYVELFSALGNPKKK